MPTTHKIVRLHKKGQPTGKQGRPQLYDYPYGKMKVGDTFRVRAEHIGRVRMHRFRYYQSAGYLRDELAFNFTITRTTPAGKTYTIRRTR